MANNNCARTQPHEPKPAGAIPSAIRYRPNTNAVQASHLDRIVWRNILLPSSTREAWGSSSLTHVPKNARKGCDSADPPFAERTPQTGLQHYGGRRPVLPCVEDSVRRPQRPGNQFGAETLFWKNPPGNSPSRITRNRRLCRNALAGRTGHLASMSALCASRDPASSKNPRLVVQKLWMPAIPCGKRRKNRTELRRSAPSLNPAHLPIVAAKN